MEESSKTSIKAPNGETAGDRDCAGGALAA
jgi:hypothetical protein